LRRAIIILALAAALPAGAQESASFKLTEHVRNAGGNPSDGIVAASTNFRVTLDSIGDSVAGARPSSASFRVDGGFVGSYPPPGEVMHLRFIDKDWLSWDPEGSAVDYSLYRNGSCLWSGLSDTSAPDTDNPISGTQYYYLATVVNTLQEEGTMGFDSEGYERPNDTPCP
jgi:hypothetical protein